MPWGDDESDRSGASPSKRTHTDSVRALRAGDSFGELALLYDSERTATVTCARDGSLWAISRQKFREVAHNGAEQRIREYKANTPRSVNGAPRRLRYVAVLVVH